MTYDIHLYVMKTICCRTRVPTRAFSLLRVTVVGGGSAAHVLAGYVGSVPNVEVSMLNTLPKENNLFTANMRVVHRNSENDIIGTLVEFFA